MRVGLVGCHVASGLGEMNRQLVRWGGVTDWMVVRHPNMPNLPLTGGPLQWVGDSLGGDREFVKQVDVVLFVERPHRQHILYEARVQGKPVVCVPNWEWTPRSTRSWTEFVDLFVCPTKQCFRILTDGKMTVDRFRTESEMILEGGQRLVCFPWPVDTERFRFCQRTRVKRFLFCNGWGGWNERKGLACIVELTKAWPEVPLIVRSQKRLVQVSYVRFPNVEYRHQNCDSNADLYTEGDVLLVPHSVDGLGLSPMEAMARGMPVIVTEGEPWNEHLALARISTRKERRPMPEREVDWMVPDPKSLEAACRGWLGIDVSEQSREARVWAESRSWDKQSPEFRVLLESVVARGVAK